MILQSIVTSMPMFVCAFFAVLLLSDLRGRAERRRLFFFFLVATLLYLGHCLFFNRELTHVAWADTAYAFSNMAVYPLFFLYLSSLVCEPEVRRRHRWQLILLPAMLCTAVIALLYGLMTEEEHDQFVYGYLYNALQVSLSGLASWRPLPTTWKSRSLPCRSSLWWLTGDAISCDSTRGWRRTIRKWREGLYMR